MSKSKQNSYYQRSRKNNYSRRENVAHDPNFVPHKVPDHPLIPSCEPTLVTSNKDLKKVIKEVQKVGLMSMDTEFIGEHTFYPILCLIQVATPTRLFLIDPMVEIDLLPFWELISDPDIKVIVHAGLQDLEPAVRATQKAPAKIIDVQIAAGFIGLGYPQSLLNLVSSMVGVKLKKQATLTHWDTRPLSNVQLDYAAADVRYLIAIESDFNIKLKSLNRDTLVAEEMQHLTTMDHYQPIAPEQYRKLSGSHKLSPRSLEVLKHLYTWRCHLAQKLNMPQRAFLKDAVLVQIAQKTITQKSQLTNIRHLPTPVIDEHAKEIIQIWQDAKLVNKADLPQPPHPPLSAEEQVWSDSIINLFNAYAFSIKITPQLITSALQLKIFMLAVRNNKSDLVNQHDLMQGWRKKIFGEPLKLFLEGKNQLSFSHSDSTLQVSMDSMI